MRELRVAVRRLTGNWSFALAAIVTLAVGIAATTAMFSVVDATLLRPLPYPDAKHIHTVRTTMTDGRFTIGLVASEEIASLRRSTDAIVASALVLRLEETVFSGAAPRQVTCYGVSEGFFELFGLPMALGRGFAPEDHSLGPATHVVLSSRAWRGMFGADPGVVGSTVRFAGGPAVVVGVMPAAFAIPRDADFWFPQHFTETVGHGFDAFVRFKPGVAPAAVQGSLGPMWEALAKKYPDQEKNRAFVMRPLLQAIVGDVRPIVVIAFAATGLLLLLALVNVSNLMLARGTTRAREFAIRAALGATRGDQLRSLLAESLTIALASTVVALPLALAAVRAIVVIGGARLPRVEGMHPDLRLLLFSTVVMIAAAILVGVLPAMTTGRVNLAEVVNEGGRGALHGRATRRALGAMIVVEVTLAIVLVAGAGRLLLSMQHLLAIDPGFTSEGRLAIDVLLPFGDYRDPARISAWSDEFEARLRGLGATAIGMVSSLPLRPERDLTTFVDITNRPTDPASRPNARLRKVSPGFFQVFGIRILAGRPFTADDRRDGAPVVIVNRAWVRKFIPNLDPLRERVDPGQFITRLANQRFVSHDAAIVGVADDIPYSDLTREAEPTLYVCDAQSPLLRRTYVIATADGRPERLAGEIREALKGLDPQVPAEFEPVSRVVATSLVWPKLGLLLMATFGAAGIVLAATGVFGVIAFVAAQRSGEMAVRLALGATRGQVFGLILAHGGRLAVFGLALGVPLAWWMGRLMGAYVYHVSAGNWLVLGGSASIVFAVALAATLPSARRAATTQPSRLLRT